MSQLRHFFSPSQYRLSGIAATYAFILSFLSLNCLAQDQEAALIEESNLIASVLGLKPGMTIADVGAGNGRYSAFMADKVGNPGKVYATEIEQEKVDEINKTVAGKDNVTVILGEAESTGLPDECCDRILLRRVYHHFQHPKPMLESILTSLKPGGVIAIIDFLPRADLANADGTPEDHEHGTTIAQLIEHVTDSGFELVRQVEPWPSRVVDGKNTDYCVLFRRPK